ncbi:MAG: anti-sigma factor [Acidobacteriota bacterium]
MNTADHLTPEDLALFALGFLPEDDLKDAIEHMEHCESCRNDVAQYQGDLAARYGVRAEHELRAAIGAAEMHTPPAAARERLLRRVAKEKKPVPIDRDNPVEPVLAQRNNSLLFPVENIEDHRPRRGLGWLAAAGWILAIGASIVAGMQYRQRQHVQLALTQQKAKIEQAAADAARATDAMQTLTDSGALQVSLQIPPAPNALPIPPKPDGHAAYMPTKGALVFIANHLATLPAYKTYELWVIPPGQRDPIPAGIFKPDATGSASVVMPDIPRNTPVAAFGVTVEDDGGTKTPTMSTLYLFGKI